MKIAIGAITGPLGGPRTYAVQLARHLQEINRGHVYMVLTDDVDAFPDISGNQKIHVPMASAYTEILWDHWKIPRLLRKGAYDIYHNTKNVLPILLPCKGVVTVHDMAPFLFPHTFTRLQGMFYRFHIRAAVKKAEKVITDSESSRQDIARITGIPHAKIVAIPLGVAERFHPADDPGESARLRKKYGLRERICLHVGTLQPRKNVDVLMRAFARLKKEENIPHQLVLVGRKGWGYHDVEELVARFRLERDVVFTGPVPDRELPVLYQLADFFVNPSSYEGFGLTCLEAMACGTPVIATQAPSFPENLGDAALLVKPHDAEDLREAMRQLIENQALRDTLSRNGLKRSACFSWRRCARETLHVYHEIMR